MTSMLRYTLIWILVKKLQKICWCAQKLGLYQEAQAITQSCFKLSILMGIKNWGKEQNGKLNLLENKIDLTPWMIEKRRRRLEQFFQKRTALKLISATKLKTFLERKREVGFRIPTQPFETEWMIINAFCTQTRSQQRLCELRVLVFYNCYTLGYNLF